MDCFYAAIEERDDLPLPVEKMENAWSAMWRSLRPKEEWAQNRRSAAYILSHPDSSVYTLNDAVYLLRLARLSAELAEGFKSPRLSATEWLAKKLQLPHAAYVRAL